MDEDTAFFSVTIVVGSISVGLSLMSGTPSTVWMFLNTVLLVHYMPLQISNAPIAFQEFTKQFNLDFVKLIPYLSDIETTDSIEGSQPPENWRSYGVETASLYTNIRNALFLYSLGIVLLLIFTLSYFISKRLPEKYKLFFENRLNDMKWCFFFRLWIQTYLSIIVGALLSAGTVIYI